MAAGSLPLRLVASEQTLNVIDGSNVVSSNALVVTELGVANPQAPVSVNSPAGVNFAQAVQMAFGSVLEGSIYVPVAQPDAPVTATITVGTDPIGVAITPDGSYAYVTNFGGASVSVIGPILLVDAASGAITGTAFTAELIYAPTVADLGSGEPIVLAECLDTSNNVVQWSLVTQPNPGAGILATLTDAMGTVHDAGPEPIVAGAVYAVALVWTGADLSLWLNGTQAGPSVAVSAVASGGSDMQLLVGYPKGSPVSGVIDELRLSDVARYTASYTPASVPFAADADTTALYHLDGAESGQTVLTFPQVPLGREWQGSIQIQGGGASTSWDVVIGGFFWGTLTGAGPFGTVQALPGEQVTLTTTAALPASVPGGIVKATFIGSNGPYGPLTTYPAPFSPSGAVALKS